LGIVTIVPWKTQYKSSFSSEKPEKEQEIIHVSLGKDEVGGSNPPSSAKTPQT